MSRDVQSKEFVVAFDPPCRLADTLKSIWQGLLRRTSIDVNDNFFDLGGDAWLAVRLFEEISRVLGIELSPVSIYHMPTIASLAAVLQRETRPTVSPLTPLKTGDGGLPFFLVHGCGSTVLEFHDLVKHIRYSHSIYGMQARGVDGIEEPFDAIEDLSKYHLEAIKRLQPEGPYLLAGYSSGGLVALEMARRLTKGGDKIALLAMIDSYPPLNLLRGRDFVKLKVRRRIHYIRAKIRKQSSGGFWHRGEGIETGASVPMPVTRSMPRYQVLDFEALQSYQLRYYDGNVRFIKAQSEWTFPLDPAAVWAHRVRGLRIDTVPGDHLGIVTTHFRSLADTLSRYLEEAAGEG